MSREFPDWINPWSAAEGRRIFRGTLPFGWMQRLSELLADKSGEAAFRAAFHLDAEKHPVIELRVRAKLPLVCQASLETYFEPVERESLLGVVAMEDQIAALPDHYDPVTAEHGRLALARLVEDELLLGMPQIPRRPGLERISHQTGKGADVEVAEETPRKPFAQLEEMLRKHQEPQ